MEGKGLYLVTVNWYDDYKDEEKTASAFVIAKDMPKAVKKICKDFNYINWVKAEEIVCNGYVDVNCVYIPNDPELIQKIRDENDY